MASGQPAALPHRRRDLTRVAGPALACDLPEQRDRLVNRQHVQGQRAGARVGPEACAGW